MGFGSQNPMRKLWMPNDSTLKEQKTNKKPLVGPDTGKSDKM